MTTTADDYCASMAVALNTYDLMRPRSLQVELGVSSVGHCYSEALYRLTGVEPTDAPNSRQAMHGSALHEMFAAARAAHNPSLLHEKELRGTLPSGIPIMGHADEIDPNEPSVTDWKTLGDESDLASQRRKGSSDQQRFQRHLYYYLAHQNGLVPAEGIVRNWWVDRAGYDQWGFVEQEPFDMEVVHSADAWLTSVKYSAEHGEETPREKHYDWCSRFCEFFTHCRSGQNADLIITDPELIAAAEHVYLGRKEAKEASGIETAGKRVLAVLQKDGEMESYTAGDYRIRMTWVNSANGGYWKTSVNKTEAA